MSGRTPPTPDHAPARSAALANALARCEAGQGQALRLRGTPAPAVAAALLQDAAELGEGLVWRGRPGELWLLGAAPAATDRLLEKLAALGWAGEPLPAQGLAALIDAPPATPATPAMPAAGLEQRAAQAPAPLAALWRMGAHGPDVLAQRWLADPACIFDGPEPELRAHATALLASRLLSQAARGAWPAARKPHLPLLLDMPPLAQPPALPRPPDAGAPHALVLPLELAPVAGAWAQAAAAAGWGLAWQGMTPELAPLLERLPGGWVFTPWSAAWPGTAWSAPERLVVTQLPGQAALAHVVQARLAVMSMLPA